MTFLQFRRWALRGAACLGIAPVLVTVGVINQNAPKRAFVAIPQHVTTSTTAAPRAIEAAMEAVTTTTAAPVPTTIPAPPTTHVTAPPTTTAPRAVASSQGATLQERGEAALALINYPWERLGYRIDFQGGVAGVLGETNSTTHVITIFIRSGQSSLTIARTIAHEMGHALDFSLTTVSEARQYLAIRNLPYAVTDWYPTCDGCTDFGSPAGDFAETFAYYLLGPGDFRSLIGPEPTAEQLSQLGDVFAPN